MHTLRSIYVAYVYHCFQCLPYTLAKTAMVVLGHESLKDSLSYNAIELRNVDELRNVFGALVVVQSSECEEEDIEAAHALMAISTIPVACA